MKLVSWNINGLRAVMKKGSLQFFLDNERPDIACLQEIKIKPEQIDFQLDGYRLITNSAARPGYSGTGLLIKNELAEKLGLNSVSKSDLIKRNMPEDMDARYSLAMDKFGDPDNEGRVITLELPDYYLVTVYTPNAKADLSRLDLRYHKWDPAFLDYMNRLRKAKPVVFCGDLNVAAEEIDLANPKQNVGKHGFTNEEREGFHNYIKAGFIDSFRQIHGQVAGKYTWWSHWAHARERNIGWRIDYFLVDKSLSGRLQSADIYPEQTGSDHCPISIILD